MNLFANNSIHAIAIIAKAQFRPGDKKVEFPSKNYDFVITKTVRNSVDSQRLKDDGLYEDYSKSSESLSLKIIKKETEGAK